MKQEIKLLQEKLNSIIEYGYFLEPADGIQREFITLSELEKEIIKTKEIREFLLKIFQTDLNSEITKRKIKNLSVSFPNEEVIKNGKVHLNIATPYDYAHFFYTKTSIASPYKEKSKIQEKASIFFPYVRGLLEVSGDDETKNIILNSFYDCFPIDLENHLGKILVNGNGINFSIDWFWRLNLTEEEKLQLLACFYNMYQEVIERIFVPIEDAKTYMTQANRRDVLKVYKRGIRE